MFMLTLVQAQAYRVTGNRAYIYGSAVVALIILAIACINYMNLATARATRRARSVGFRKILGASRWSLAVQFLGEALLFALLSLRLLAMIFAISSSAACSSVS